MQSLLDAATQYKLISRETKSLGFRILLKLVASVAWMIAFGMLYNRIWSQKSSDRTWSRAAENKIVNFTIVALVFVFPELLSTALLIVPWIQNFVEGNNSKVVRILTWWFQSRTFVGRGLRESPVDSAKYTMFWVLILVTKFSFSYFMQIKPMIKPTNQLLSLRGVDYWWAQFFSDSNRFAVGVLWFPVVLIYLMDLQIWYSIYSSFAGAAVGLFDHLGKFLFNLKIKVLYSGRLL